MQQLDVKYQSATFSITNETQDVIEKLAKYFEMQKSGVVRFAVQSLARQYGLIS